MKTTIHSLIIVLFTLSSFAIIAHAQTPGGGGGLQTGAQPQFAPNELLVSYVPGTAESIKQQVRTRYNVTIHDDVNGELEIWYQITFPLTVDDGNGQTIQLHDLGDLIIDLDIQNNSTGTANDARSEVNGGDYNYAIALPSGSAAGYHGPLGVLPYCAQESYRLIGTLGANIPASSTVVIMDQWFDLYGSQHSGIATHADKVAHVIETTATASGLNVNLVNVPIFNHAGQSNYLGIIRGFKWLEDNNITDAVINFSASMLIYESNFSMTVRNYMNDVLNNNNLILVSSAGNEGYASNVSVFPGGGFFDNEITVAGTESCFSDPWADTNNNSHHFEIAAEAKDVVVPMTINSWGLDKGTSYSAPMVSSALLQLATHYATFDPATLRSRIMQKADQVPTLAGTSINGNVLNTTAATDFTIPLQQVDTGSNIVFESLDSKAKDDLRISPNPFHDQFIIDFPSVLDGESVRIVMADQLGRVVFEQAFHIQGRRIQLTNAKLTNLPAGTYWIQVNGTDFRTNKLVNKH